MKLKDVEIRFAHVFWPEREILMPSEFLRKKTIWIPVGESDKGAISDWIKTHPNESVMDLIIWINKTRMEMRNKDNSSRR